MTPNKRLTIQQGRRRYNEFYSEHVTLRHPVTAESKEKWQNIVKLDGLLAASRLVAEELSKEARVSAFIAGCNLLLCQDKMEGSWTRGDRNFVLRQRDLLQNLRTKLREQTGLTNDEILFLEKCERQSYIGWQQEVLDYIFDKIR